MEDSTTECSPLLFPVVVDVAAASAVAAPVVCSFVVSLDDGDDELPYRETGEEELAPERRSLGARTSEGAATDGGMEETPPSELTAANGAPPWSEVIRTVIIICGVGILSRHGKQQKHTRDP